MDISMDRANDSPPHDFDSPPPPNFIWKGIARRYITNYQSGLAKNTKLSIPG